MTFDDLLDQVVADSGDTDGQYRTDALRWLNLTRADIADEHPWKSALKADATITTSAATTDGLYDLSGYTWISGDYLFDETNEASIRHESLVMTNAIDASKDTTGNPAYWSDAGVDTNGTPQIYLWPIPDGTFTIRFSGYAVLADVAESATGSATDDFFGPLTPWGPTMSAGLRYYHDLNNNENPQQVALMLQVFKSKIRKRKSKDGLALPGSIPMQVVNTRRRIATGRFNPSHYNNG